MSTRNRKDGKENEDELNVDGTPSNSDGVPKATTTIVEGAIKAANDSAIIEDPTNPINIPVPSTIKNVEQERLNTIQYDKPTAKVLHAKGLTVTSKWDKDIQIVSPFRVVEATSRLISYKFHYSTIRKPRKQFNTNTESIEIFGKSEELFCYGLSYAEHDYDEELLKKIGVSSASGILHTATVIPRIEAGQNELEYSKIIDHKDNISGELKMLIHCTNRTLVKKWEGVGQIGDTAVYHGFIRDRVDVPSDNSPVLPFAYNKLILPTVRGYIVNLADGIPVRFTYGRMATQREANVNWTVSESHAINVCQYTAQMFNHAFNYAMESRTNFHVLKRMLEACCWAGSSVSFTIDEAFIPVHIPEAHTTLSGLMLCLCRDSTMNDRILEIFTNYLSEADLMSFSITDTFTSTDIVSNAANDAMQSELSMLSKDANVDQVIRALCEEIHFITQIPSFMPFTSDMRSMTSLIAVMLYALLQLFFPNQFWMHCRLIQNELMTFFRTHYNHEYTQIINQYGTFYTVTPQGVIVDNPGRHDDFTDDPFTDTYPTLFRRHVGQAGFAGAPTITNYMRLFNPLFQNGEVDDLAMRAEFPRLMSNPSHYIPYPPYAQNNDITERLYAMKSFFIAQAPNVNDAGRKASTEPIIQQIKHIFNHSLEAANALCRTVGHIMRTMANFPLAYAPNFLPNAHGHVNINHGVHDPGVHGVGDVLRQTSTTHTFTPAVVIALLFNTNFKINDILGKGLEGARVPFNLEMPDAITVFNHSLALVNESILLSSADYVLAYLFHGENIDQALVELREHWGFNRFDSFTYSFMRQAIAKYFMDNPTYLQGFTYHTSKFKRDGRLTRPRFVRVNRQGNAIPFDHLVDSAVLDQDMQVLQQYQINNMVVGAKMINRMRRVRNGVRLTMRQELHPNIQPIAVPEEIDQIPVREMNYVDGLFTSRPHGTSNVWVFESKNGGHSPYAADWIPVHLTIDSVAGISNPIDITNIINGIKYAKWFVTITNFRYTSQITTDEDLVTSTSVSIVDVFKAPRTRLFHIFFYYDPLRTSQTEYDFPSEDLLFQYMYPLEDITDVIATGGLALSTETGDALTFQPPTIGEYHTGDVDLQGRNIFEEDVPKVDSELMSMSNVIFGTNKSIEFNSRNRIHIRPSPVYQM
ncbi:VP3 [Erinnyis ello cypovirus 2]|nr:VP3 [Erinnyis ello cypovirus 2]